MDIIVNFLIRISLLTSDSKSDGDQRLQKRSLDLFRRALDMFGESIVIRPIYFEKVFSMCNGSDELAQHEPISIYATSSEKKSNDKFVKGSEKQTGTKSDSNEQSTSIPVPLLLTSLDLFIMLLEHTPKNNFITTNSSKVMEIISACFNHTSEIDGEMQVKLKRFILLMFSIDHGRASFSLINHLKMLMELSLTSGDDSNDDAAVRKPDINDSNVTTENKSTGNKEKKKGGEDYDSKISSGDAGTTTEKFKSYFILQVVEEILETRKGPEFIENFTSTFLDLAQKLTKNHLQNVALNSKCINSVQSRGNGLQQVLSTPVIGIMEEACSFTNQHTSIELICEREYKEVAHAPLTTLIKSLISCVRIIGSSSVPYSFTEARKSYFQILSNILDLSDNIPLLITAVGIVGNWMILGGGPMTHKERNSFLWKMTAFDNRGMSEAPTQVLVNIVSRMVISLHETCKNTIKVDNKGSDMLLGRSLMACIVCADSDTRLKLFDLYGNFEKDREDTKLDEKTSIDITGLPDRSPVDVLWQLLHSDWEGLAMRLWIVVFVECFLLITHHEGGVISTIDKPYSCMMEDDTTKSTLPALQGNDQSMSETKEVNKTSLEAFGSRLRDFLSIISSEKSSSSSGMGPVLNALRELSHGSK